MFRSLVVASTALISLSAYAADLGVKKPAPPPAAVSAMCKETKALPSDAFGITTGSDVADYNTWTIALDTLPSAGVRGGNGYGVAPIIQASGSVIPCVEFGPFISYTYNSFQPYGGGVTTTSNAYGGGFEFKYKILGRAQNGFGLTFDVQPTANSTALRPGATFGVFGNSFRLLSDAELIKDKLYGAFNIEMFQNFPSNNPAPNTSIFSVRSGLTTPVTDALYLGGEVAYQRQYTGGWLNRYQGYAVQIGPTFFWTINEKFTLNGTYAYQIAGEGVASPGRALGIDNFPRHLGRLKLTYAF